MAPFNAAGYEVEKKSKGGKVQKHVSTFENN